MKGEKGPCKAKECQHGVYKHYLKGDGGCMVRGCPCTKYKN